MPEQASSQTLASLEGTGRPMTFCCEDKQSLTEALQLDGGGVDVSTRVFPSDEAGQYSDACCWFRVFEHNTKI